MRDNNTMTTPVSNPNSGRNKSSKEKKHLPSHASNRSNVLPSNSSAIPSSSATNESINTNNNQPTEEFRNKIDKFQPTAEQMRIASLMNDKKDDDLKPKIEQIVELTGASKEDAAVALYDCDNDMEKAIDMILEGEAIDSEWQSTGRKKKTKGQNQMNDNERLTNGDRGGNGGGSQKPLGDKTNRKNNANNLGGGVGPQKGHRGSGSMGAGGKQNRKPKDFRNSNDDTKNLRNENTNEESSDVFTNSSPNLEPSSQQQPHRSKVGSVGGKRGGGGPGRGRGGGSMRGRGMARGSRTFMNRGLQSNNNNNTNTNNNNDGFPNSIETWTNNAVESSSHKPSATNDDLTTMTVGNWSDVAANEEWVSGNSEDEWASSAPMETKVFTPSTKVIPEKDELKEQQPQHQNNKSILNHTSSENSHSVYLSSVNSKNQPEETSQQPTMRDIISNNMSTKTARPSPTAGQALLQQIQQSQNVVNTQPNSNLNHQYSLTPYQKQATESIKSLVGMTSNNMISTTANEHSTLENLSKQSQQAPQQSRMKSKIPESAVEMPSSDPISNLSVHFGSLEFSSSNFPMGTNDTSGLFDAVNHQNVSNKKNDKNLPLLSSTSTNAGSDGSTNYRTSNTSSGNAQKNSLLQGQVLTHSSLNDSLLNNDHHRNDKSLNANSYQTSKPAVTLDRKNDYISQMSTSSYKSNYAPTGDNNIAVYSNTYQSPQSTSMAPGVSYYSTNSASHHQVPFGTNTNQTLIQNNAYNTSVYNSNSTTAQKVIRDIDNNSVQQAPQVVSGSSSAVSNKSSYDSSNVGSAASLIMSSSTSTTNAIKNTSSTAKGIHNQVPPGVTNSAVQPTTQVLSTPYIMSNAGLPLYHPYHTYDPTLQFPTTARDPNYSPYATAADMKYNRNTESDMLPVSSQAASAVQTATQQAHNHYMNYPTPGYGFFYGFPQNIYSAAQPAALYHQVPQAAAQNTASAAANSAAFAKPSTTANYGSHSYNSAYDSMGNAIGAAAAQTQQDYVTNKPYQQQKHMANANTAGDMSGANSAAGMYSSKGHPQMNKNYDKQGFQAQAPQMNLTNPAAAAQSAANLSSAAYNAANYALLHQQPTMHHSAFAAANITEPTNQQQQLSAVTGGGGNPRGGLSQAHKNQMSSNAAAAASGVQYSKFNWN